MRQLFAATLSVLLLQGCANGLSGFRPLTYTEPGETRVFVSYADCNEYTKSGKQVDPIISAILLGAASKALENFGTFLSNAAAGGNLPAVTATANFETPVGKIPKCVMVARGQFDTTDDDEAEVLPGVWSAYNLKNSSEPTGLTMPKVTKLQHYIELQLFISADKSAITFAPVYSEIRQSMDGTDRAGAARDVSIALAFARPGQSDVGSVVVLSGREIAKKDTYTVGQDAHFAQEAPWFSTFSAPPQGADTPRGDAIPVTAKVTVIETRPSREFLMFVASVFSGSVKPAIDAQLKQELDPASLASAAATGFDSSATYAAAYGTALSAVHEYCGIKSLDADQAGTRASKSSAARAAQIKANKAAFEADLQLPFENGKLISVSSEAVSTANGSSCSGF